MVSLNLKAQPGQPAPESSGVYSDWLDVETTWIEGKAGCPHCGKSLKVACDKDMGTLHIQKDDE